MYKRKLKFPANGLPQFKTREEGCNTNKIRSLLASLNDRLYRVVKKIKFYTLIQT